MSPELLKCLTLGYGAQGGHGSMAGAMAHFTSCASDPKFLAEAKTELARSESVSRQCFASRQYAAFLRRAFDSLPPQQQPPQG